MAQIFVMMPEHAHIVDSCRAYCLQAVTYALDKQWWRTSELLACAYRERNEFPVGTPAAKLCIEAINKAELRITEITNSNI